MGFSEEVSAKEHIDSKETFNCDIENHGGQIVSAYWRNKDKLLLGNKKYSYEVQPFTYQNEVLGYGKAKESIYTPSLKMPKNLCVQEAEKSITLSWEKASLTDGYAIYRTDSSDDNMKCIAIVEGGNSYTDTEIIPGVEHCYYVIPFQIEGVKKKYCNTYAYAKGIALQAPQVTWLAARYQDKKSVQLYWKENNQVDGYVLYRRTGMNENYSEIATLSNEVTSFIDETIEKGEEYYYTVSAYWVKNGIKYESEKTSDISPVTIFSEGYQSYSVEDKIEIAQKIFPEGSYWNHYGISVEGMSYEEKCMMITSIPCDHKSYVYCCNYYYPLEITREVYSETMQCLGFANMLNVFFSGNNSQPREFKDFESLQVGDQIRIFSVPHSVIVIGKNEDSVIVGECNRSLKECDIMWGRVITRSELETESGPYVFLSRMGH